MKKRHVKSVLAILLAFVLIFTLLPVQVFAGIESSVESSSVEAPIPPPASPEDQASTSAPTEEQISTETPLENEQLGEDSDEGSASVVEDDSTAVEDDSAAKTSGEEESSASISLSSFGILSDETFFGTLGSEEGDEEFGTLATDVDIAGFKISAATESFLTKLYGENDPTLPEVSDALTSNLQDYLTTKYGAATAADFEVIVIGRDSGQNVGAYPYTFRITYDPKITVTGTNAISASLTITKRELVIATSAAPDTVLYGTAPGDISYKLGVGETGDGYANNPGLGIVDNASTVFSVAPTSATSAYTATTPAGSLSVTVTPIYALAPHGNTNYTVVPRLGTLTVEKKVVNIGSLLDISKGPGASLTKLYGDNDPTLSAASAALTANLRAYLTANYDAATAADFSITVTGRASGQDVGAYPYTFTVDYNSAKYTFIGTAAASLTITKQKLKISTSATPDTVSYGTAPGGITYNFVVDGYVNSPSLGIADNVSTVFSIAPTATSAYTATTPAGSLSVPVAYALAPHGSQNYTVELTLGRLTVEKKSVDITSLDISTGPGTLPTKVYGEDDPALPAVSAELTANLQDYLRGKYDAATADAFSITVTGRTPGQDVGAYPYTLTVDYDPTKYGLIGPSPAAPLTITKQDLTIKASATPNPIPYGTAPSAITYNLGVSGYVNNPSLGITDNASTVFVVAPTSATSAYTATTPAGTLPVTVVQAYTLTPRGSQNYNLILNSEDLIVGGKTVDVTGFDISLGSEKLLERQYAEKDPSLASVSAALGANLRAYLTTKYDAITAAAFTVTVTGRDSGEDVGKYDYSFRISYDPARYIFVGAPAASLEIVPRYLRIETSASPETISQGAAAPAYITIAAGFAPGDSLPKLFGPLITDSTYNAVTNNAPGIYKVTLSQTNLTAPNYTVDVFYGEFTVVAPVITPAPPAPPAAPRFTPPVPIAPAAPDDEPEVPVVATPKTITPPATPRAATPPTPVPEPETPLAAPEGAWALINLLLAVLAFICFVALAIHAFTGRRRDDDRDDRYENEEDRDNKRRGGIVWRIIGIVAGIASPILFILTEDITLPMILVDMWTIWMVVIAVIQLAAVIVFWRVRKTGADEDDRPRRATA